MKLQLLPQRILAMSGLMAIVAVAFVFSLFSLGHPTYADTPTQLVNITPSSTEIKVDPGGSTQGSVDVINQGSMAFKVTLSSEPYRVTGLNYNPSFTPLPGAVDASKWITFNSVVSQDLASKKLLPVDYTVTAPIGTQPGGYYAVIFAETSSDTTQSGVIPRGRVGDIIYITVNGTVTESGTVSAPKVPFLTTSQSVPLSVIVGNTGGLHFQTTVEIYAKTIFGKTVFSNTENRYVLPQTQREITEVWKPGVPIGIYKVQRNASLPDGVKNLMDRWVIVVEPWVFVALVGVIFVIIGTVSTIRQFRKRRKPPRREA
jgi:hypothetical protein